MSPHLAPSADAAEPAPAAPSMAAEHEAVLVELMQMGLDLARGVHRQATDPEAPRVVEGDVVLAYHRAARAVRYTLALRERLAAEQKAGEADGPVQTHLRVTFVDPKDPEGAARMTEAWAAEAAGHAAPASAEPTAPASAQPASPPPRPAPFFAPPRPAPFFAPPRPAPFFAPHAVAARTAQVGGIVRRIAEAGFLPGEYSPRDAREAAESFEREAREGVERLSRERVLDADDEFAVMRRPVSEIVSLICRDLGLRADWAGMAQEPWAQDEIDSGAVGEPLKPFSSPAGGGGGPRSGGGGAAEPDAPSVTPPPRRATFPAGGEGEEPHAASP